MHQIWTLRSTSLNQNTTSLDLIVGYIRCIYIFQSTSFSRLWKVWGALEIVYEVSFELTITTYQSENCFARPKLSWSPMLLICMEMNLHRYKSFTWILYYILYILHSDERAQPVLFDDRHCVIMWDIYLSLFGGGRSGRRIPFWCNLGRALTLPETQSSQVMSSQSRIHSIVTTTRAGKFWIIKLSMSFQSL